MRVHTHTCPHTQSLGTPNLPRESRALETESVSKPPAPKASFLKGRSADPSVKINAKLVTMQIPRSYPRPDSLTT